MEEGVIKKMSAFIVSDNHILSLVSAAQKWMDIPDPQMIVDILIAENYRSVNHRYRNERGEPHRIVYKRVPLLSPVVIIKACNCYDYQACETNDYKKSGAAAFIDNIRDLAITKLPGYEEAPWGID